ncbi:MAG: ABC transporter ATP-binding protein [Desulfuromonadales bacterium]|nr:ABC transporter ATP-binding protein [Desulfuromonadales bacterium]
MPPSDEILEICNLSKTFDEGESQRIVFRELNASIRRGEFVVLLGRSGSGKSTLLNLISGIDLPTEGEVLIGGQNLTTMTEQKRTLLRRNNIGFVFQFYNLIPTLTVIENLLLPLELKKNIEAGSKKHALQILEQVSLADRANSYPDRLSGGEQQRIAICRALIHKPLLLLADEPTGNLDVETGAEVLNLLNHLIRDNHMTTLMVTHSPEVAQLADRVMTIRDGALVEHSVEAKAFP